MVSSLNRATFIHSRPEPRPSEKVKEAEVRSEDPLRRTAGLANSRANVGGDAPTAVAIGLSGKPPSTLDALATPGSKRRVPGVPAETLGNQAKTSSTRVPLKPLDDSPEKTAVAKSGACTADGLGSVAGLHLYHAEYSNCSMRVRLLLAEKGIDWTSHPVDLKRRENLEDWYLQINPKGLVPAIIHDGRVVTESNDILVYLEERFPDPPLAPKKQFEREEMLRWVKLSADMHIKAVKTFVYASMDLKTKRREDMERYREFQPDAELAAFHQKSIDGFTKEDVAEAVRINHELFEQMEAALGEHRWLAGAQFSLADIAWYPNYALLAALGFPLKSYPHLQAWAKAIERRPACRSSVGVFEKALRAFVDNQK